MKSSDFKDLRIWNKAMDLALEVYDCTRSFPEEEKFGLISQMRRCAVSIPSNIAEGHARNSNKHFIHFLKITLGSNAELETQTILSYRLGFLSDEKQQKILKECKDISKMAISFVNILETNQNEKFPPRKTSQQR